MNPKMKRASQLVVAASVVFGTGYVFASELSDKAEIIQDAIKFALGEIQEMREEQKNNNQDIGLRDDLGEFVIDGETKAIQTATEDVVKTVINRAANGSTPGVVKGDHGKELACLQGTMTFNERGISKHLIQGVVKPGYTYTIEARLSNAEDHSRMDRTSTSQGVALKLKDISKAIGDLKRLPDFPKGVSDDQDFLMTSAPIFFLDNIVQYAAAFGFRANVENPKLPQKVKFIATHPYLIPRSKEESSAARRATDETEEGRPESFLSHPYWSKHPYAWGERPVDGQVSGPKQYPVKYSVEPCEADIALSKKQKEEAKASDKNYQVKYLTQALDTNKKICFYFRVQTRPGSDVSPVLKEQQYPVENGHKEWDAVRVPFERIAKIEFSLDNEVNKNWLRIASQFVNDMKAAEAAGKEFKPTQEFVDMQAKCGATEFTPWNGLMAHQPLSNLARGRRDVYKASALMRTIKPELDERISKLRAK